MRKLNLLRQVLAESKKENWKTKEIHEQDIQKISKQEEAIVELCRNFENSKKLFETEAYTKKVCSQNLYLQNFLISSFVMMNNFDLIPTE